MKRTRAGRSFRAQAFAAVLVLVASDAALAQDDAANASSAAALRAKYALLKGDPGHGQFQRPLYMDSSEGADGVAGEILAQVAHPFAIASAGLNKPSQWCEVLILHLNTKYCRPGFGSRGTLLQVSVGAKHEQPTESAYRMDFGYRVTAATATFLQVKLDADEGPLGTRDYRIVLEAMPDEGGRTLIRLAYSYSYGTVGRLAMEAYLGTVARRKIGFTVVGRLADGEPRYVGGMRGVVERNTMRYYLAIESHLAALALPAPERAEWSFRDWFAAVERYPRQLHEIEREEYLSMKRKESARQQ